jgi:hypothetical protein
VIDCFADKAVIAYSSDSGCKLLTPSEFALPRIELLYQGRLIDFHEWEIDATTQIFGRIATRASRYGKSGIMDGETYGGFGNKFFQLVDTGSEWRIASLAWVDDRA